MYIRLWSAYQRKLTKLRLLISSALTRNDQGIRGLSFFIGEIKMKSVKIRIIKASYGFEVGKTYDAVEHENGYYANSGTLGKLIDKDSAVIV